MPSKLRESRFFLLFILFFFYWRGFQREHRLNSPSVIQCVLMQCIWNENGWSCTEKDYFKGHCCYFVCISMLLSDFDPIQHNRMGLISENKGCSLRRGLMRACNPMAHARGHLSTRCAATPLGFLHSLKFFPPLFFSFHLYQHVMVRKKKKRFLLVINQWIGAAGSLSPNVWVKITSYLMLSHKIKS